MAYKGASVTTDKKAIAMVLLAYGKGALNKCDSNKSKRINRILQACRSASDADLKLIERVLRI